MSPSFSKSFSYTLALSLMFFSGSAMSQEAIETPSKSFVSKTEQVPGYFRSQVGSLKVTALFDGIATLSNSYFKGVDAKDIEQRLRTTYDYTPNGIQTSVNAYLVDTGHKRILVDVGTAECFGKDTGYLLSNLKHTGYQPSDIDAILLTHLHPDHACGLVDQKGQIVFKNASVYVNTKEAAHWLISPEQTEKLPKEMQPFFHMAQKSVEPYQKANRLKIFTAGEKIIDSVESIAEYGHTPGHTGYLFSSGKEQMLIWGDVLHSHNLQFKQPEISFEFDFDPKQAISTRKLILAETESDGILIGGAHMPFPGLGHVVKENGSYIWVPTKYLPIKSN